MENEAENMNVGFLRRLTLPLSSSTPTVGTLILLIKSGKGSSPMIEAMIEPRLSPGEAAERYASNCHATSFTPTATGGGGGGPLLGRALGPNGVGPSAGGAGTSLRRDFNWVSRAAVDSSISFLVAFAVELAYW